MQRATCNAQHATCNMQRATCNAQHGTRNMQRATAPHAHDRRLLAANTLLALLCLGERTCALHLKTLFAALCSACADEEEGVRARVLVSNRAIGASGNVLSGNG